MNLVGALLTAGGLVLLAFHIHPAVGVAALVGMGWLAWRG